MAVKTIGQTTMKVYKDSLNKLRSKKFKLQAIENKPISDAELFRRVCNIPVIDNFLENDSKIKAKRGGLFSG